MHSFYEIIEEQFEDASFTFKLKLNADHGIYNGHFPEFGIVPGTLMMNIVRELAEKAINKKLRLSEAEEIKFLRIIYPSKTQILEFKLSIDNEIRVLAEICIKSNKYFKMRAKYLAQI